QVDTDGQEKLTDAVEDRLGVGRDREGVGRRPGNVPEVDQPVGAIGAFADEPWAVAPNVREDILQYDRIYLPRETLADHGVTEADVEALRPTSEFRAAMRDLLARTEREYHEGVSGIEYLPHDCRFPVLLAAVLYADHHRLIRRQDCDVLSARPTLSLRRRLWLVARTWVAWRRHGDPVTAFYRVTGLSRPAARQDELSGRRYPGGRIGRRLLKTAGSLVPGWFSD
ncbi:MAG: phytoene/squalene synthase family protein, partial [Halobacteriaceae archaeon]